MNHLIHRVRVELRVRSRVVAVEAQELASRALQHDLPAALEAVFDRRFPENTTYRLDRLEVDIGPLPAGGFRKAFLAAVTKSLKEVDVKGRLDRLEGDLGATPAGGFRKAIPTVATKSLTDIAAEGVPSQAGMLISEAPQFELRRDQAEVSESDVVRAFLFYVVHGSLPWFFPLERWRDEIPKALISGEAFSMLRAALPGPLRQDPKRLLRLLPFPDLVNALLDSEYPAAPAHTASVARTSLPGDLRHVRVRLALWYLRLFPEPDAREEVALLRFLAADRASALPVERNDFQLVLSALVAVGKVARSPEIARLSQLIIRARGSALDFRARERVEFATPESPGIAEDLTENGVPTESAGIVLLHPFFIRFFQLFGWLDDRLRILDERRWHAVHAMRWIVHRHPARDDVDLVLEKALCGIPLGEVACWPALEYHVIEEAESLLRAVIGHWKALKDTSPDGLREAFLARPGLFYGVEPPRLHVETRAYDMLLSLLPWSFDRVALPWLRSPIQVRWPKPS
jgi:hypothetical protein